MDKRYILSLVIAQALCLTLCGQSLNYKRTYEPRVPVQDLSGIDLATSADQVNAVTEYFDGLGRPIQSVNINASPRQGDIVSPVHYDAHGRQDIATLPFSSQGGTGSYRPIQRPGTSGYTNSEQYLFYQGTENVAQDTHPYAKTVYEGSPLDRMKQQGFAGSAWQPSAGNVIEYVYSVNQTEEEVFIWTYDETTGTVSKSGNYVQGELLVNISKDEHKSQTREYTDKTGRMIFKKIQESSSFGPSYEGWQVTYYIYDRFGNVRMVIPPQAFENMRSANDYTLVNNTDFRHEWLFVYDYDDKNRLIRKHIPGAGAVHLVYDKWDRLVLTQDGNRSENDEWSFTKYDHLNRPAMTGITTLSGTLTTIRNAAGSHTVRHEDIISTGLGYTLDRTYPTTVSPDDVLQVNYYDDYDFPHAGLSTMAYSDVLGSGSYERNILGFATGGMIRLLDGNGTWLRSVSYYDDRYRLIQFIEENNLSGTDRVTNSYNFSGQLVHTRRQHTGHQSVTLEQEYAYDHNGRLVDIYHNMGTNPNDRQLLARMEYNETGQLVRKYWHGRYTTIPGVPTEVISSQHNGETELAASQSVRLLPGFEFAATPTSSFTAKIIPGKSANPVFSTCMDYSYTIRGWLENSGATLNEQYVTGDTDLFRMELLYEQTEAGFNNKPQFNGNISAMKWRVNDRVNTPVERIYGYDYDKTNRLTDADFAARSGGSWTAENSHFSVSDIEYDKNGNITDLKRNAYISALEEIDNLDYVYQGNQLVNVRDVSSSSLKYEGFNDRSGTPSTCDDTPVEVIEQVTHTYNYDMENSIMGGGGKPTFDIGGNKSSDFARSGSYSLKIASAGSSGLEIPVKQGDNLDISVWAYSTVENGEPMVRIHFVDPSGVRSHIATLSQDIYNTWYSLAQSGIAVVETGTIEISLEEYCECGEPVYFDDLSVVLQTEETVVTPPAPCPIPSEIEYEYDENGNMTKDLNKEIESITYNHLNLPEEVTFDVNRRIRFLYDASGRKWQKKVIDGADETTTDYQGGIHYLSLNGTTELDFIQTEEGRLTFPGGSSQYEYFVKDHLGNTRLTFKDISSEPAIESVEVVKADYTYDMETDVMEGDVPRFRIQDGTRSSAQAHSGSYSMAMFDDFEEINVPVLKDEEADVSVWVYRPTASAVATVSLFHQVTGSAPVLINSIEPASMPSWQKVTFPDVAITDDGELILRMAETGEVSTVYYDEANFVISEFEEQLTGFIPDVEVLSHQNYYPFGALMNPLTYRVTHTFMATMENAEASNEEQLFENVGATRTRFSSANHTEEGHQVARLDAQRPIGPSLALKVSRGDTVSIETYAYYEDKAKEEKSTGLAVLAAVLSTFNGGVTGAEAGALPAVDDPAGILGLSGKEGDKLPGAYLNYLQIDKNGRVERYGFVSVSEEAKENVEKLMIEELVIDSEGYLYIYVSNEGEKVKPVYFDDLTITQHTTASPEEMAIAQGMMMASLQVPSENRYLYNGKEFQGDLNLNLYDYEARSYDPYLGRFNGTDPLSESYYGLSPFVYTANNPVRFVDPDGKSYRDHRTVDRDSNWWGESMIDNIGFMNSFTDPGANDLNIDENGNTGKGTDPNDPKKKKEKKENGEDQSNGGGVQVGFGDGSNSDLLFWLSNAATAAGTGTGLSEAGHVRPDGSWKGKNGKWWPANQKPNGATGSRKAAVAKAGKWGFASKLFFYAGVVVSSVQFAIKPTLEQGLQSAQDISFGGIGYYGGPIGVAVSTAYFADVFLKGIWPGYKEFQDTQARLNKRYGPTYVTNGIYVCFEANTLIYTEEGLRPIEELKEGINVYSYNFDGDTIELQPITKHFTREVQEVYEIKVGNEFIIVTAEHPFYVQGKEWVKVKDLVPGDLFQSEHGCEVGVSSVSKSSKNVTVYNIEVAGNHNYYVSPAKVLVHNKTIPATDQKEKNNKESEFKKENE